MVFAHAYVLFRLRLCQTVPALKFSILLPAPQSKECMGLPWLFVLPLLTPCLQVP